MHTPIFISNAFLCPFILMSKNLKIFKWHCMCEEISSLSYWTWNLYFEDIKTGYESSFFFSKISATSWLKSKNYKKYLSFRFNAQKISNIRSHRNYSILSHNINNFVLVKKVNQILSQNRESRLPMKLKHKKYIITLYL